MRIRSLEITGFKSFGDRVVLAFDRGISAIVGPNGCGKSNVVDAIRWVMGEQNPRHLRGRAMEDVIFSGTEGRPSVGLAEVVLTFDNSEGLAPAPYHGFGEIQVARRLYRSGESEYLINRTPVRLRDVTDFFLDTGVGTRGYTIVEQGKIAEIVSTRPEDRRVIFEEAAGIGKYRQRRRETERKLQATEQNLLRVTDILGELRRQQSSLDRQARKASRYKELTARVRELELAATWEEARGETERLGTAERELAAARDASASLDARVARAEAELETERRRHLDLERELSTRSERLFEVRSEIQALESRVEFERREREGLLRLAAEREVEVGELEGQLAAHETALQQALRELAAVDERIRSDAATVEQREGALREETRRHAELQGRRDGAQARLVRLASESATLESRAESLDERRAELERRLREREAELERSAQEVEAVEHEEQGLDARLRDALSEREGLGRRLATVLRSGQEARAELAERSAELASQRELCQEMRGRLETLREAERQESGRAAQVLASLPETERGRVRGLLSEVIRVEEGAEAAVEAVLGVRLDAILVDDAQAALELLAAMRREKAGRATAVPIAPDDRPLRSGFVPLGRPLVELVSVDAAHRPLAERLLADAYLVDSLAEAVRRFGAAEPPALFVTRDGEVLDRAGALTGGAGAPSGALARSAEIRRQAGQLQALEARAAELERAEAAASGRSAELERELENARSRHHTSELVVVNVEKDLERARERSKALAESAESGRATKATLLDELERVGEGQESARSRLELLGARRREEEDAHERLTADLGTLAGTLERSEARLVQARVELAQAGARRDQLRESRERAQSQVDEGRDWIERRNDEVRRAREHAESLAGSVAEAERSMAGRLQREEELRAGQQDERERYEASTRRVEALESETRDAARERDGVRERVGAHELAVQEARLRREQVRERILERYDVDLDRYRPPPELRALETGARDTELRRLRASLESLGDVHLGAIEEYEEVSERHRYLSEQKADLELAIERLRGAIARINRVSRARFRRTFEAVNERFQELFPRVFAGGRARLALTEAEDVLEAGIEITAQPPGKKLQNVNLLSGGEKALTAIALLFAVFAVKPSPFFLLDEVDAALDDANVGRFDELLRETAAGSQLLIITHNKASIESADTLYGVTMEEPGLSKLVTVDLVS